MKTSDLRRLTALAEARKQRDLAELEALASEDRRLVEAIKGYASTYSRDFQEGGEEMPLSQFALRLEWAERSIAVATRQRAELHKKIALLRKRAAVSLGKHQALEKLSERTARQEADQRQGREQKEAPSPEPLRDLDWDPEDPQAAD